MVNGDDGTQERPPSRSIGILLMMPVGAILVFALIYFSLFRGGLFPGEWISILLVIFIIMFIVRLLFWRSRQKYWGRNRGQNSAVCILRERYARGEITREQFKQMLQDLKRPQ